MRHSFFLRLTTCQSSSGLRSFKKKLAAESAEVLRSLHLAKALPKQKAIH